jgi:hypothetical protein
MSELTLDPVAFDNRFAGDNKLYVVFFMQAVKNGGKSELEGRPIFDDVPHVTIHIPGDKNNVVTEPVSEEHKQRFAPQWEKFQKQMSQSPEGTPLEQWPLLTTGQVHELKAVNVMTVEQLAGMSDAHVTRFMGGYELRRKAMTFLKVSKDSAEAQRLATLNDELTQRLIQQDAVLRKMAARLEVLEEKEQARAA